MASKTRTYARVLTAVLADATEEQAPMIVQNFKQLLKKRGDLKLSSAILQEFTAVWSAQKGIVARVITATPLSDSAKRQTEQSLKEQGFVLEEKVEPTVIGGTALFLGKDYLIDGTVRGRLQKLTRILNI